MADYNRFRLYSKQPTTAEASQGGRVRLRSVTLINCSQGLFDWVWLASRDSLEILETGPDPKPLQATLVRSGLYGSTLHQGAMKRLVLYAGTASGLLEQRSEVRHAAEVLGQKLSLTAPGAIRIVPLKAQ